MKYPAVVHGQDHVGDAAVDHIVAIERDRSDDFSRRQPFELLAVGFAGGEQGEFGQHGAQQRRRCQRAAEFFHHHRGVGQFTSRTAELLRHEQSRGSDVAEHRPQRLVVAEV